ncbi:hypothetical protein [Pseudomonas coronafaciens]|uniref:hypothetical protein n=1 Tax=Pseudomonas coronafaciens TaxID=53409 RepID=UPI000EFE84FA|nr:hypothetical protein [Pseudomonas coronafaciens]
MIEQPKRLTPTRNTVRELYLKSGNRCAFPGCKKALFNSKGLFVAQVCHIEAAESGGERFNPNQTNEERRDASNLMLMCYDHHIETNNVAQFPAALLKRYKAGHEVRFSDVVGVMVQQVCDHTTLSNPLTAVNLLKIKRALSWGHSKVELDAVLEEVAELASQLKNLPIPCREFFLVLVNRAEECRVLNTLEVSTVDIKQATDMRRREIREFFSILDQHGLTFDNGQNDSGIQMVGITKARFDWPAWRDIKLFCKQEKIDVAQIILGLNFALLDE